MSSFIGKQVRYGRIFSPTSKRSLMIPLDYGLTMDPISGLNKLPEMVREGSEKILETLKHRTQVDHPQALTRPLALIIHQDYEINEAIGEAQLKVGRR